MKKILLMLVVACFVFVGAGCEKKSGYIFSSDEVKTKVQGWMVYTNPAYRYELRVPQTWTFKDSGEDGYTAEFFPKTSSTSALIIRSQSNWQEPINLEEYYKKQTRNLLEEFDSSEIEIGGTKAILFQDISGENTDAKIDVIALDLGDRIIEITIAGENEMSRAIVSSLKFYPANAPGGL
ncbi:hypothetical protein KKC32_02700 [Patescibacteria group bacterium]|nr:hypothetical protein [Patescibacteria group bacterium]